MVPLVLWGEAVSQAPQESNLRRAGGAAAPRFLRRWGWGAYLSRGGEGDIRVLGEMYSLKQYVVEYCLLLRIKSNNLQAGG